MQTRQLTNRPLALHRLHGHLGFELRRKLTTFYRHKIDSENREKNYPGSKPSFWECYMEGLV